MGTTNCLFGEDQEWTCQKGASYTLVCVFVFKGAFYLFFTPKFKSLPFPKTIKEKEKKMKST